MEWQRGLGAVALVSGALALGTMNVGALPLTASARDIASGVKTEALSMKVAARRAVPSVPRLGAPRIGARPIVRGPGLVRPPRFARRRVIIGIGPGFYYDPYPYYYGPYYFEAPDDTDTDAIASCIRRFKSYDVRTRTYLGFDGLRHPCP